MAINPTTQDVYVSDRGTNAVFVYTQDGTYKRTLKPKGITGTFIPLGIAFSPDGQLYVTEAAGNIQRIDPNLAEGLPVKDALFVVKDGEAHLLPDPPVSLNEKPDWHDDAFELRDGVATTTGHRGNARLCWKLRVSPYRCYHVSVKVRTQDYTGRFEIKPIVGRSRILAFTHLGVKGTQDWTEHHIVFSSLDAEQISIYMGTWGDATGQLQLRDWKIEEADATDRLDRLVPRLMSFLLGGLRAPLPQFSDAEAVGK